MIQKSPALNISIHAPHARSDEYARRERARWHISIHAPHARSDEGNSIVLGVSYVRISIHAPHARSDVILCKGTRAIVDISIHAPHARSDLDWPRAHTCTQKFQSTLLMRGATCAARRLIYIIAFQSTLLMRGATIPVPSLTSARLFQSTLLMRGATEGDGSATFNVPFQSTLLMRGATSARRGRCCRQPISIHAPHARSDDGHPSSGR